MFDFSQIRKREYTLCQDCGDRFRALPDEHHCVACQYYRDHPELALKHWTWKKRGQNWTVVATWPDGEPLPLPGDSITVHRKDTTTSTETISEIDGFIYDQFGKPRLHCWVQ